MGQRRTLRTGKVYNLNASLKCVVSVVSEQGSGQPKNLGLFSCWQKRFFFPPKRPDPLWFPPSLMVGTTAFSPGVKVQGRVSDKSLSSSSYEVKSEFSWHTQGLHITQAYYWTAQSTGDDIGETYASKNEKCVQNFNRKS